MYREQPELLRTLINRSKTYNETLDFLANPPADCKVHVIAPDSSFCVKRLTMDKKKLLRGYAQGRRMGRRFLTIQAKSVA